MIRSIFIYVVFVSIFYVNLADAGEISSFSEFVKNDSQQGSALPSNDKASEKNIPTQKKTLHSPEQQSFSSFQDKKDTQEVSVAQESSQDNGMAEMASFAGEMMQWGGQIANDMAEDMPEDSVARDALKLGGAVYTDMGTAVEKAAAEEAANPQGDEMVSAARIWGRAMQAGGKAASRTADDLSPDSPMRDLAKVGGAAYSQAGAAAERAAAEEAANPQGGGFASMVKIGGRAMQAGGQAATQAADDLPEDSHIGGFAKLTGEAYYQAGKEIEAAGLEGK